MTGDRFDLAESNKTKPVSAEHHDSGGWFANNVLDPFINGSGVVQVYNTFADKKIAAAPVDHAATFTPTWAVQTLASTAGAIIPYVVAGKVFGAGMRGIGEGLGVQGGAARFLASESAAQIFGAGGYEMLKQPNAGETRLGNAAGTMAGFAMFEGGNRLLSQTVPISATGLSRLALTGAGRFGVGAAGGLLSYDTTNLATSLLTGHENQANWDGRFSAMASGGFINVALPAVQRGMSNVADFAVNSRSFGKGVPVDRFVRSEGINDPEISNLVYENKLARVRQLTGTDSQSKADVKNNVVELNANDGAAKLAHELKHLRLAHESEAGYKQVADVLKTNPAEAEQQFYALRAITESTSRQLENRVQGRSGSLAPHAVEDIAAIGNEIASGGKTYSQIWQSEWAQFKNDPSYRPRVEYSGQDAQLKAEAKAAIPKAANDTGSTVVPIDKAILGMPDPLGATLHENGVNFSVSSHGATAMNLLIFPDAKATEPSRALPMFQTDTIWHRFVPELGAGALYLYQAHGPYTPGVDGARFNSQKVLLDPYAKAVTGDPHVPSELTLGYDDSNPNDPNRQLRPSTLDSTPDMPKGVVVDTRFDWKGDKPPLIPMTDAVIYELNVRGFTGGMEKLGSLKGTYRGLIEQIPYLKDLGVTSVELMPVMKFPGGDGRVNPETGEQLTNAWGYNTIAYHAPEERFAADGNLGQQVNEFKTMVQAFHDNGMEVIMDVVFNHTGEGNPLGPTYSFKGLDNNQYYMLMAQHPELYEDKTGCGNTVNANNPMVQKFILDALRYWVQDMHVDGFRFDLATVFNYDVDGQTRAKTPIIAAIENDPVLSKVKLIAEPWDIYQYRLGQFSDKLWAEWNGDFRDRVRSFVKSDPEQVGPLADRIAGSPHWFDESQGRHSVNFVTAHDGFTMADLTAYNTKHNEANGEQNRDGSNDNKSWNGGVEGPLDKAALPVDQKAAIENLRVRQIKNMMSLLLLSRGTPMLLSGDEFRRTQDGNNNAYNQDRLNMLDWGMLEQNADMHRFTKMMLELRKDHQVGRTDPNAIVWHGAEPFKPDWSVDSRLIAFETKPPAEGVKPLYSAFNAYWEPIKITLPPGTWARLVDTNLPAGQDIVTPSNSTPLGNEYVIQPRSGIVLEKR